MKKILFALSLMVVTMTMMAVPAKRGQWKTLKLQDGSEVRAMLVGDEHGHFWKAENGQAYAKKAGTAYYTAVDAKQIAAKAKARRQQLNAKRAKRRTFGHPTTITGKKKAIMILVNYKDVQYQDGHDNALFQKIANQENYNEGKFKGSMADYFKAQSRGKFELDFDVVGPVTVSKKLSYYGENDDEDQDMHAGELVCEAVKLAKDQISDWTPYDWDNDGYVDQVYVVYAGMGEADGGDEETIWPHAYSLSSAKYYGDGSGPVTVGTKLKVDSYACGPELNGSTGDITGIGVMCHEYSHCLGYPDFYDIDYSDGQGMGEWDLMDSGSYNGDSYQPAGYTSYERWFAGWEEPIELKAEDVSITGMKSLQNGGEFYIIYNDKNADEYYLLENRQFDGWDASLPDAGLLILHCDYDANTWEQNGPNDDPNHQRLTVVPADGEYSYFTYQGTKYYDPAEPFPHNSVNAFNKDFKIKKNDKQAEKAAKFFTKTSNGTYWMSGSVEDIMQNGDGTISFNYVANYGGGSQGGDDPVTPPTVEGALFYESFSQCDAKGGNDDQWSGQIANGEFNPDNDGWEAEKAFGANQCAKFGTSSVAGSATTPAFALNGTTTMTFKAGAWKTDNDVTTLILSVEGGSIEPASVEMEKGAFKDFMATITGSGNVKVTFEVQITGKEKGRFFLDEVLVVDPNATAIQTVSSNKQQTTRIYTLDGRYVGTDPNQLPRGMYIINGKKVVK
jgi:M6 family metalloprotease-like protein